MSRSSKKADEAKLLTSAELELMRTVWKRDGATVHEVLEALPADRKLAYTSVSTILRILEQKKFVGSRKEGRGHVYFPKVTKESYEALALKQVVTKVFDASASSLVRRLCDSEDLSRQELEEIRRWLDERLRS